MVVVSGSYGGWKSLETGQQGAAAFQPAYAWREGVRESNSSSFLLF